MAIRQIVGALAGVLFLVSAGATHKAEAQNWDGSGLIRFGVFLQGSFVDFDITQTSVANTAALRQSASPDGIGAGISAGYDLRLGYIVIGAEADVSFDDGRAKASPLTQEQYGIDYFATLRGRLGFIVHPSLMIYATAGYSLLGAEYKLNSFNPPQGASSNFGNKKNATLDGFVYGGGIEWDMGWGITFLEYLHSDTDGWDFRSFPVSIAQAGNRITVDGSSDVVRLGLKFKVGHDYAHDVYKKYEPLK